MARKYEITDTTPEARRVQIAALRKMGMEGRVRLVDDMYDLGRSLAVAGIRMRHPDYDDGRVTLALARMRLGKKLFREVYGDVEVKP